ncbi:MAG: membrane protein insertase YidC, partial [Sciscionella sp.]
MLNFIYYPVSFILWCWHRVFGLLLGPTDAVAWALSIVFLVFTLRALLLKPAISQVRSMRKMQEFAPQMKALQKKYANDKQRQAQEMQKLQKENGFNPVGGCLPMVFQIPVFIGLYHVLRNFSAHVGSNYMFNAQDIANYRAADLFGAHLDSVLLGLKLFGGHGGFHPDVAFVAIPLMIIASITTHFTARLSVRRQQIMGTQTGGQAQLMSKLTLYLFPLGVLIFGLGYPVGLLLYWL